ncbi:hypothetical protein ACJ73_09006, partial [Blastomyces percursus]
YRFVPFAEVETFDAHGQDRGGITHERWGRVHQGRWCLEVSRPPQDPPGLLVGPLEQKHQDESVALYSLLDLVRRDAPRLDVGPRPWDDREASPDGEPCRLDGQEKAAPSSSPAEEVADFGTPKNINSIILLD